LPKTTLWAEKSGFERDFNCLKQNGKEKKEEKRKKVETIPKRTT